MESEYQMEQTRMAGGGKQRLESLKLRLWGYSKLLIMTRYKVGA